LDVGVDGHAVVVQWQADAGFGVSCSPEHSYGEGADEVYLDSEAAYSRVVSLILSRTYTAAPPSVQLRGLRKERGISQVELADLLKIKQAAVSRLEGRHDALVSTIRAVVNSMGGTLRIIASFPDGFERALDFGQEACATTK